MKNCRCGEGLCKVVGTPMECQYTHDLLDIGTTMWHPCSIDIIEHKVTGVREYEDHTQYELTSKHKVGASGIIKVLIAEKKGQYNFIGMIGDYPYESGLQDFVEGKYYSTNKEAKLAYYKRKELQSRRVVELAKNKLAEAEAAHNRLINLIKVAKDEGKKSN